MILTIDQVPVIFPYDYIYPEQYAYMQYLKRALDARPSGHCLLEMPSGTGKTTTLLSFILAYQSVYPQHIQKLIYCARTVPEMNKTLTELQRLVQYRNEYYQKQGGKVPPLLGVGLASRRHLCIHPVVSQLPAKSVDAACHAKTASWIRDKSADKKSLCTFFENLEEANKKVILPSGVYNMDDLKAYGERHSYCPYFLARESIQAAHVVVYSYHYLLDPKIAELVSREMSRHSVVVFDEAHNIDNVCIESMSIDLTRQHLDASAKSIELLNERITTLRKEDAERLKEEYARLIQGLKETRKARSSTSAADQLVASPVLSDAILEEAVPGNIRRAEHFIALLRRFIGYLRNRMKATHVMTETPLTFLQHLQKSAMMEERALRFCAERLQSLVRTLELTDLESYGALQRVAHFATLLGTYRDGFVLLFEPWQTDARGLETDPIFHLACMDATLAMKPVFERFDHVIVTSGTLSPLDMYPKLLGFQPVIQATFPMTLARNCFCPLIVTRGSDQVAMTSKFEVRNDPAVVRNYGALLIDLSKCVPDGLACFFPSYIYLESIVSQWHEMGILNDVMKYKLVFIETPDAVETSQALQHYRLACDTGRGAVLLSVARGKVSEGIDFDHHYGRAVVMFGIPYQYTESRILKARLEFMREHYRIRENDFLSFDAMRHAAQCVGRAIRNKTDYGLMIFADKRYTRQDKRAKLPLWIHQGLFEANANLSTDLAVVVAKKFFRQMAQPVDVKAQIGHTLWTLEDVMRKGSEILTATVTATTTTT